MATKEEYRAMGALAFEEDMPRPTGKACWMLAARQAGWDAAQAEAVRGWEGKAEKSAPSPVSVRSAPSGAPDYPGVLAAFADVCVAAALRSQSYCWDQAQQEHVACLIRVLRYEPLAPRAEKLHHKILVLINRYHRKVLACVSTSSNPAAA